MRLFGKKPLLPQQLLASTDQSAITGTEEVLAAANRVSKKFSLATEANKLAAAIATAQNKNQVAKAFADANIGILDTNEVKKYQVERIRPTWREQLTSWSDVVGEFFERILLDSLFAKISGLICLFITVPLAITFLADMFLPNVSFTDTIFATIIFQLVIIVLLCLVVDSRHGSAEADTFADNILGIYRFLHAILGLPLTWFIIIAFSGFHKTSSDRKWTTVPLKGYKRTISNEVALKIDQIMTVLPNAKLELQVLEPTQDDKDEFFLTLPLGKTGDEVHLWHKVA